MTNATLAKRIREGDQSSAFVLARRVKPKSVTEFVKLVYGNRFLTPAQFEDLMVAYDEWRT